MKFHDATLAAAAHRRMCVAVLLLSLPALCATVAHASDRGADGKFDQRTSSHFILYQDVDIDESGGLRGSRRFEDEVLDELEAAYDSLDRLMGLRPKRRIQVVIYDPAVFDRQYQGAFRFQAAGFYQGVICIRGATTVSLQLSRVLHHELVHAALDAAAPSLIFPGWVNEGGAEWFEARALGKRGLSSGESMMLSRVAQQGALFPVQTLNVQSFARMGGESARLAYLQSYALIDHLARNFGIKKLQNFYAELIRSRNLDRALKRVYRMDSGELEQRFLAEVS